MACRYDRRRSRSRGNRITRDHDRVRAHDRGRDHDHGRDHDRGRDRDRVRDHDRAVTRERIMRSKRALAQALKENSRVAALEASLDLIEAGEKPSQEHLRAMLELAAAKRGPDLFAKTLQCCILGGIELDAQSFTKLMGLMVSRETAQAQVRVVLNMALAKDATPIPLVPEDFTVEETKAAFEDAEVEQEDGEISDSIHTVNSHANCLEFKGCVAMPELNGLYHSTGPMPDLLHHDRPVYMRDAGDDLYAYFWQDDPKAPWLSGWWLGKEVGAHEVLAYNPSNDPTPPRSRWHVMCEGQRRPDPGCFVVPGEEVFQRVCVEPDEAEAVLTKVDLTTLQGALVGKNASVVTYFGHFMALLHLEHLAEVNVYRRRLLRHPMDKLVRMGWTLNNLACIAQYGQRESRRGLLPGWPDKGTEFVAFSTPPRCDLERLKFRKGDSVLISRGDPMKDKIAEGSIVNLDHKKIVVNLMGSMPGDA